VSPSTTRDNGFPDLGTIDDYDAERGCGHVLSILDQELFSFDITEIPEIRLQRQMMSGQTTYHGKYFSYDVRKTKREYEAFSVQVFSPRVPGAMQGERRRNYSERIRAGLRNPDGPRKWIRAFRRLCYGSKPDDLSLLLCLLVNSRETTNEYLCELMCSSFSDSERNLSDLISVLQASRLDVIRSNINIEKRWLDIGSSIPEWLRSLTASLYGSDELARLSGRRGALERERIELQEARQRERWENFLGHPAGIRNMLLMANVCFCGSNDIQRVTQQGFKPNRHCRICPREWHVDRCWNCGSMVDSRDPETPPCSKCNWLICANCDACADPRSYCPRPGFLQCEPAGLLSGSESHCF
jgi:hypothetical protein